MSTAKDSKRILSVSINRLDDPDGDWSCLGEFSDEPNDGRIVCPPCARKVRKIGAERAQLSMFGQQSIFDLKENI